MLVIVVCVQGRVCLCKACARRVQGVCVCERERERQKEREKESESVCVYVKVVAAVCRRLRWKYM